MANKKVNTKLELQDNSSISPLSVTERSSAPSSPVEHDVYLDDGTNTASGDPGWRRYTGAAWEDVAAAGGGAGSDTTAIHDNVNGEILAVAEDTTPIGTHEILAENAAGEKKSVKLSNLISALLGSALPENVAIILDPELSLDGKYSGIVETGTAGATLAFGDLCYLAVADSRWELAKADVAATSKGKLGVCVLAAAGNGSATTMLMYGKVRADTAFPTFTIGAPVFISAATAGDVTSTAPTGTTDFVVRIVGESDDGNTLFFSPDMTYVELV